MQGGVKATIPILDVMRKSLILTGTTLRGQDIKVKGRIARNLYKHAWPLIEEKKIKPVIDHVYSIKQAQKAHDHLRVGRHIGKVVMVF